MYSTRIDGEPTTFGTSGLLYRSNKLMYDRATNTLWSELLGEPVIGPLADSGIELRRFPLVLTTWGEWLGEHSDTTVLSIETGLYPPELYLHEEVAGSIYFEYRTTPETMFPIWDRDSRLATKQPVLGLSIDGVHKAYPIDLLQRERVVNDVIGGAGVVVVASSTSDSARIYETGGRRFAAGGDDPAVGTPGRLVDADGVEWEVTEEALVSQGAQGERLVCLPSQVSFWFGWFAFHPDTEVYAGNDG